MSEDTPKRQLATVNLRTLKPSPKENPLVRPHGIELKDKKVYAGTKKDYMDPVTGEVAATSIITTTKQVDSEQFVKMFSDGVTASYGLTRTAFRVFQAVLEAYQNEGMSGGYNDCVRLYWFDDGLNGESIGMSEKTYQRGLKELIAKEFLYPRTNELYWINPHLFFKGDRAAFVSVIERTKKIEKPD